MKLRVPPFAGGHAVLPFEVLPEAQRRGVGRSLLHWATAQADRLLIVATPGAAEFYTHTLPGAQRNGLEFIVKPEQMALAQAV